MANFRLSILLLLSLLLLINASETSTQTEERTPARLANETATSKEGTNRKERLNVFSGLNNGLLGLIGSDGSSSSSSSTGPSQGLGIAQGLKGIQQLQKFVSRFQNVVKVPFSFRGVTDSMATLTGLLAAVGGGYLTYVTMVAMFGSMLDPQNTAYQTAYSSPPHQYAPPQGPHNLNLNNFHVPGQGYQGAQVQGYNRRQSNDQGGFYWGSYDLGKMYQTITHFNYPEASFKLLRIKDESCKQRAVCELEKFLAKKGVASVILKGVSKKINGMEKYLDAAYRGLANEDCGYAFSACPYTLGQTLLRTVGLS